MQPQEWDAFKVYYRQFPRFDPWKAMAMTCQVVFASMTGKEVPIETFMPRLEKVAGKRGRKPRPREMATAEDFDRAMRI